jgi:hypothetical protein
MKHFCEGLREIREIYKPMFFTKLNIDDMYVILTQNTLVVLLKILAPIEKRSDKVLRTTRKS